MDKNIFGEVDNLPEEDKKRMTTMVEQLQTRDRYVSILLLCLFAITIIYRLGI